MAIKYPSITPASTDASPSAHHLAVKLPTQSGDVGFDTFTLDYAGGRQVAYTVVIIQNAVAESTTSVLNVNHITLSQEAQNLGFSLDPQDGSGNLEMGASVTLNGITGAPTNGINLIRPISSLANFDATTVDEGNPVFDSATHCLVLPALTQTDGTAHAGVNAQALKSPDADVTVLNEIQNNATLGTYRVIPLYLTGQIEASANPLNQNEYAAFVLRYAPGAAQPQSDIDLATLSIETSAGDVTLGLSAQASNIFAPTYSYLKASYAGTLLVGQNPVVKSSGATLDLGLFPVGTDVSFHQGSGPSDPSLAGPMDHFLKVNDGSPQIGNAVYNLPSLYSVEAATIEGATAFNFLTDFLFNQLPVKPWVDNNGEFVEANENLGSSSWYLDIRPKTASNFQGVYPSTQLHALATYDAPYNFTKAEATCAAQVNFTFSDTEAASENATFNHNFIIKGGFYYPLSIEFAQNAASVNNSVAEGTSSRRRAKRTLGQSGTNAEAQGTMFGGDTFNMKIIMNYQNYSGAAYSTASVNFSNDFPLLGGTYTDTSGTDVIYPKYYKPNTNSVATVDVSVDIPWDTSGILNGKEDFVIEVPVRAKTLSYKDIYSNPFFGTMAYNAQSANYYFYVTELGAYITPPETDSDGARQNDGSFEAELTIDGDEEGFISKLGPYSKSYYASFFPAQAKIRPFAKPSTFIESTIHMGSILNHIANQTAFYTGSGPANYIPRSGAAASPQDPLQEDGSGTFNDVGGWFKASSSTAVENTPAAFLAIDGSGVTHSSINYDVGANLNEVYFSGRNGADRFHVFNSNTEVYKTNPSMSTIDGATGSLGYRFSPFNQILEKAAKYDSTDQNWYADVDLKFDNIGDEETALYKVEIGPSNLVDISGATAKPSGAATPTYSLRTIMDGTAYEATPSAFYTIAQDTGAASYSSISEIIVKPPAFSNFLSVSTAAFAALPPKTIRSGDTVEGSYKDCEIMTQNQNHPEGQYKSHVGGYTKVRFKVENNANSSGDYYAMLTLHTIDNSFDNNMKWDSTENKFVSANVADGGFKVSIHRYILKFSISQNSVLAVTDLDTAQAVNNVDTIEFGNITVG